MRGLCAILVASVLISALSAEAATRKTANRDAPPVEVPRASPAVMDSIAQGAIQLPAPVAKRKRYAVKEKHWKARLAAFQQNEFDVLALAVTTASDGSAVDWYYLAMIAKERGGTVAARRYIQGAVNALSNEIRSVPLEWSSTPEQKAGCGIVKAVHCPSQALTVTLAAQLRELDAATDRDEGIRQSVIAGDAQVGVPDVAANIVWRYGHERVLRYFKDKEGGTQVLVPPDHDIFSGEPTWAPATHVRVSTSQGTWVTTVKLLSEPAELLKPDAGLSALVDESDSALAALDEAVTGPTDQLPVYLHNVRTALDRLRALPESYTDLGSVVGANNVDLIALRARVPMAEEKVLNGVKIVVAEHAKEWMDLPDILALSSEIAKDAAFHRVIGPLLDVRCSSTVQDCGALTGAFPTEKAASGTTDAAAPYLLMIAAQPPRQSSLVVKESAVQSSYVSGTREVSNPRFYSLQAELQTARTEARQAELEYYDAQYRAANQGGGVGLVIAQALLTGVVETVYRQAQAKVTRILSELAATPPTLLEDVTSPYQYSSATTQARYEQRVGLLLVQRASGKSRSGVVAVVDETTFEIPVGMHPRDASPTRPQVIATQNTIGEWLSGSRTLSQAHLDKVSWKDNGRLAPNGASVSYEVAAVRALDGVRFTTAGASATSTVNAVLASTRTSIASSTAIQDPRLKHVVVVKTASGHGSGFYVGQRNVVTNAHVVGSNRTVTVRQHGEREAVLARVVAVDPVRDLALLQTELAGPAVSLLGNDLPIELGARISVIGHPHEFEFTLTAGIVSAVRPDFGKFGGVDVIQTDTAINPGNSGGPVFLGDTVIGVVAFMRDESQGLGFAIHVSELREFLATAYLQ